MRRARTMPVLMFVLAACGEDSTPLDRVEKNARFTPDVLVFGEREPDVLHSLPAKLSVFGGDALQIKVVRFEPEDDAYAARKDDGGTLRGTIAGGAAPVDLEVRFRPTTLGSHDTTMVLEFAETEARLPIEASAVDLEPAMAAVAPSSITFGVTEMGSTAVRTVVVTNDGEASGALRISGDLAPFHVTAEGGGAIDGAVLVRDEQRTIEVRFSPLDPGTFSGSIAVALGDGPAATIEVGGEGRPAGALSCVPAGIMFGGITRGMMKTESTHCTVTGGTYTLDSVGLMPAATPFRLSNTPPLGVPLTTFDLSVEMDAVGLADTYNGVVSLLSRGGQMTAIPISGTVMPPSHTESDLALELTWTAPSTDFDLHLTSRGALPFSQPDDCYFEFKHVDWGQSGTELDDPFLDRDARTGPGPEQINLARADGTYDIYVQYFDYGMTQGTPADVQVTYWLNGTATQISRTMATCGSTWHVGTVVFTAGIPAFTASGQELGNWSDRTRRCR